MNDTALDPDALDPLRPWIHDERQLPARMNWIDTLFNPAGASATLHFTRGWTLMFFCQMLIVVLPFAAGIIVSLAGGDASPVTSFGLYASPVVFVLTTVISFILHARRLNDAGKPTILAIIVLVPLIIGLGLFTTGVLDKSAAYDQLYQKRAVFLADPAAWRTERLTERKAAQDKANQLRTLNPQIAALFLDIYLGRDDRRRTQPDVWRTEKLTEFSRLQDLSKALTAGAGAGQGAGPRAPEGNRGGRNGGARADQPLPSQIEFILKPNVGTIQLVLFGMNLFIMIWSLLWVARVPDFARAGRVS